MSSELKAEIIRYCEEHQDTDFEAIASHFNISREEAQSVYMDWVLGF